MKINGAKRKMLAGKPAYGYAAGAGSPQIAEALAYCGIDFVLLDTQHGSWGTDTTISALAAMSGGAATPMARVARNDYTMIGRLLDEGALGIVVPMVHTPEDARAAAAACRFPPQGDRSWGWGRAARYGDDYADRINDEVFLAVQIESIQAVENAREILSTPGVDGCWIGPADLGLSLGVHPRDGGDNEQVQSAIVRVLDVCRNTGKIPGIAASTPTDASHRAEQGFRFLTAGSDLGFMIGGANKGLKTLGLT